jgi:hypothetical protein
MDHESIGFDSPSFHLLFSLIQTLLGLLFCVFPFLLLEGGNIEKKWSIKASITKF